MWVAPLYLGDDPVELPGLGCIELRKNRVVGPGRHRHEPYRESRSHRRHEPAHRSPPQATKPTRISHEEHEVFFGFSFVTFVTFVAKGLRELRGQISWSWPVVSDWTASSWRLPVRPSLRRERRSMSSSTSSSPRDRRTRPARTVQRPATSSSCRSTAASTWRDRLR